MKTKMTNTNKIITAYKENEPKIKIINHLSSEIENTLNKKNYIFADINKAFQVIFHNFATERINTGIKIKYNDDRSEMLVFINKEGISVRTDSSYNQDGNTTNIFSYQADMFIGLLKGIKEKELEIQQHIKKKEKQDILHNFLEDVDLLDIDNNYKKSFKDLEMYNEYEDLKVIKEMVATARQVHFSENYQDNFSISTHNTGLSDKLIIEQIFEELKVMLEEYLAKEQQAETNAQIFLDKIKEKFNAKLIVAELKKQNA